LTLLEPVASRKQISWQPMWFATWLGITAVGLILHPDPVGHGTHQELGLPPCPSVLLFDRPCPGCGLTTSWSAFLHGNFSLAFHAHPLGPLLYLGFTASALTAIYGFWKLQRLVLDSVAMSRFLTISAFIFLAFGLVRMAVTPHFRSEKEQLIVSSTLGR
jgi:hypothetical protein